jgi:hypothetical protein
MSRSKSASPSLLLSAAFALLNSFRPVEQDIRLMQSCGTESLVRYEYMILIKYGSYFILQEGPAPFLSCLFSILFHFQKKKKAMRSDSKLVEKILQTRMALFFLFFFSFATPGLLIASRSSQEE